MSKTGIIRIIICAVLSMPGAVRADGMYLTAPDWQMYEPAQQAFIDYDAETGTEELSILPSFSGNARAFAWIVPVPALPEVAEGDDDLFRELDALTRPVYHRREGEWGCMRQDVVYSPEAGTDPPVDVIANELVGYYQTMTVAATEAPALLDSLTAWGFLHEENRNDVTEAITDYVERSWYFVTVRIDSTALARANRYQYETHHLYGHLAPIRLTFASDEIVYPMKISAISAREDSRVRLYVAADHRLTYPGAVTHYANRFTAEELADLSRLQRVKNALEAGDFLTELFRVYQPEEMTMDIALERAPNDDEFLQVYYSGFPWTGLVVLLPALYMGARRRFWLVRCRQGFRLGGKN